MRCDEYSSKACENLDGKPDTPLGHDKVPSEVLRGHLQCIDVSAKIKNLTIVEKKTINCHEWNQC